MDSPVIQIVNHIHGVEELRESSVDIYLRRLDLLRGFALLRVVRIVKNETLARIWSIIVHPVGRCVPKFLRKHLSKLHSMSL